MRGKQRRRQDRELLQRLIPAYAGKTRTGGRRWQRLRAHPRVCGENHFISQYFDYEKGSSPRMRGKHQSRRRLRSARRLIPAYAGKTQRLCSERLAKPAHPRVCGENRVNRLRLVAAVGSSPRMRGKPIDLATLTDRDRLIPAYAGKTSGM